MKYLDQFLSERRRARRAWFIGSKIYKYGRGKFRYGRSESSYKEKRKRRKRKK